MQDEDVHVEDIQKGIWDFSFRYLNAILFVSLTALGRLILIFVWTESDRLIDLDTGIRIIPRSQTRDSECHTVVVDKNNA